MTHVHENTYVDDDNSTKPSPNILRDCQNRFIQSSLLFDTDSNMYFFYYLSNMIKVVPTVE